MIGNRLRTLRKDLKITQDEMGKRLGVNASAISQMESGKINPSLETLHLLSSAYGANLHWLITGKGSMYEIIGDTGASTEVKLQKIRKFLNEELQALVKTKTEVANSDTFELQVMGEIAAGLPAESPEPGMEIVNIRSSMINGVIDDYVCLRVNGHSMEPQVWHNDFVIIRQSQDWFKLTGHICAVRLDGAITLKKLTLDDRSKLIVLLPINEEYKPMLVNPQEHQEITLIGSLFYLYRKF